MVVGDLRSMGSQLREQVDSVLCIQHPDNGAHYMLLTTATHPAGITVDMAVRTFWDLLGVCLLPSETSFVDPAEIDRTTAFIPKAFWTSSVRNQFLQYMFPKDMQPNVVNSLQHLGFPLYVVSCSFFIIIIIILCM